MRSPSNAHHSVRTVSRVISTAPRTGRAAAVRATLVPAAVRRKSLRLIDFLDIAINLLNRIFVKLLVWIAGMLAAISKICHCSILCRNHSSFATGWCQIGRSRPVVACITELENCLCLVQKVRVTLLSGGNTNHDPRQSTRIAVVPKCPEVWIILRWTWMAHLFEPFPTWTYNKIVHNRCILQVNL